MPSNLRAILDDGVVLRAGRRLRVLVFFHYEITRHDLARRRLCKASLHLANFSRIRANQISGSDFRVARRLFSLGILPPCGCGRSVHYDVHCTIICILLQSVTCHHVAATIAHCWIGKIARSITPGGVYPTTAEFQPTLDDSVKAGSSLAAMRRLFPEMSDECLVFCFRRTYRGSGSYRSVVGSLPEQGCAYLRPSLCAGLLVANAHEASA